MEPINLCMIYKTIEDDELDVRNKILQNLQKNNKARLNKHEYKGIELLVQGVREYTNSSYIFDNFFIGYTIPQISKEFDLIKIDEKTVINIEIKSRFSLEKIKKQLIQNQMYLKNLNREIYSYTIVTNTNKIYKLENNKIIESDYMDLYLVMETMSDFRENINVLFSPKSFLVSPLNDTKKFLEGKYFLTDIQNRVLKEIVKTIKDGKTNFFCIEGKPGTGKTLLIMHIAKKISINKNVCLIFMGNLTDGHEEIKRKTNIKIYSIKKINRINFNEYDVIIFDETHRMFKEDWKYLEENILNGNQLFIFSMDPEQVMSIKEKDSNTSSEIYKLNNIFIRKLTEKVRSNPEITDFIVSVLDQSKKDKIKSTDNIKIIASKNYLQTNEFIKMLTDEGYQYVQLTPSIYVRGEVDKVPGELTSHQVIGQDLDKVIVVLNRDFYYEGNILKAKEHPNPNYLYVKLFYVAATRARNKLVIIIENNIKVLKKIISLINH